MREPVVFGDIALVPLTQGKVAVIDTVDLPLVRGRSWCYTGKGRSTPYATTGGKGLTMHRHLMRLSPGDGKRVDHRDGNGLNNRRSNLRLASPSQNGANARARTGTSSFKGVSWSTAAGRWEAYIVVERRRRSLGFYDDEIEAASAYDAAALEAWGEFARPNFPAEAMAD